MCGAQSRHEGASGVDWSGLSWGVEGGTQAREAALWAQLQREFLRRHLLPKNAVRRLDAIGFQWHPEVRGRLQMENHCYVEPNLDCMCEPGEVYLVEVAFAQQYACLCSTTCILLNNMHAQRHRIS
jgi:hypothetical protein